MDVKVDTPFSWCRNCKAFVLESETFYDGEVYETLYSCKNSGICTLCERAREEENSNAVIEADPSGTAKAVAKLGDLFMQGFLTGLQKSEGGGEDG